MDVNDACERFTNKLLDTETLYCTDFKKAECLNQYFASISNIDDSKTDLPKFEAKTNNKLESIQITIPGIEDIISSLSVNKAVGPDLISHKLLKNVKNSISFPFITIIYQIFK